MDILLLLSPIPPIDFTAATASFSSFADNQWSILLILLLTATDISSNSWWSLFSSSFKCSAAAGSGFELSKKTP
jgi:hypothetical protein